VTGNRRPRRCGRRFRLLTDLRTGSSLVGRAEPTGQGGLVSQANRLPLRPVLRRWEPEVSSWPKFHSVLALVVLSALLTAAAASAAPPSPDPYPSARTPPPATPAPVEAPAPDPAPAREDSPSSGSVHPSPTTTSRAAEVSRAATPPTDTSRTSPARVRKSSTPRASSRRPKATRVTRASGPAPEARGESRAGTQAAAPAVATNTAEPGGRQLARGGLALLALVLVSAGLVVQAARLQHGGREA
jgi:hypothetical protein